MIGWHDLPEWLDYLIRGLMICTMMAFSAVIVARAGRNPYWALLVIVPIPFLLPLLIWILAYAPWPPAKTLKKKS